LPGGGPAYPLAALGARARLRPNDALTFMLGAYNGSPAPNTSIADPQIANGSGVSFPLNRGLLLIAEMQYAYPSTGAMRYADEPEPLPRRYKLGVWFDTADFPDQQYDNVGLSLANPASNGLPLNHHGAFGAYAVADQVVWVDPADAGHMVSLFARVLGAPQADRNLITFSMNAGLVLHRPLPGRSEDTLGIGMGYAKVSGDAAALDRMTAAYSGSPTPIRGGETFVEVTYQYQATPWWQLQPDIQYVFNPGGGLASPNNPTQRIGNELVLGVRTNILF
ncbi:MAG TPA: carbohydrate porin, partial [Rhodopila sp.]|nr:carbohydrate porin [Rhodopila sp.]